jgi:Bacterial capsule synthesis protein PGA_cap
VPGHAGSGCWPKRAAALCALAGSACAVTLVVASAVGGGSSSARAAGAAGAGPAAAAVDGAAERSTRTRRLTVAWAGDTVLGSDYGLPAERGRSLLQPVAATLRRADLTAVNYEGTLATSGTSKCPSAATRAEGVPASSCFAFRAPPENAATLRRAGVDIANLANNHAFDYGPVAMGETADALRTAGVKVTGRPGEVTVSRVGGVRVAALGFAAYPWANDIRDIDGARATIRYAAGLADIVIVFVHAGAEGEGHEHTPTAAEYHLGEPRGDVRAFAHAAVDAGADLVLGSGPHVLRGIELYRGRVLAYSLGNLAGYRAFSTHGSMSLSGVLRVTVGPDGRFASGRFTSLRLSSDGIPAPDPSQAAARLISRLGRQDFSTAAALVGGDGRLRPAARR